MIQLKRTTSDHPDFIELVKKLDAHLTVVDGDEHDFYDQYNSIDVLKQVVLAYNQEEVLGCGAFKFFSDDTIEIKRMYTLPKSRGTGVASGIVKELESWAKEKGYTYCILETGIKMPDAIGLYIKLGYDQIPNYGQYTGKEMSKCFKKEL